MKNLFAVAGTTIMCLVQASCGGPLGGSHSKATAHWSPVLVASHDVPPGWAQGHLSAALVDGGLITVGLLRPLASDDSTEVHPVTIDQYDYTFVERPSVPRFSSFPRVIRASADQIYLFWGEFKDAGSVDVWGAHATSVNRIRYARHSPDVGWSDPVTLVEGYERIDWIPGAGSIAATSEGEVHLALVAGSVESDILHVAIPSEGDARVQRIPTSIASPYTAIDVHGDSVLIAYTAIRPTEHRSAYQVHIVRSIDGGRSWDEPYNLNHTSVTGATFVRLVRTIDDHLHLLIGEAAAADGMWTKGFVHMSSEDWGRNWRYRGSIDTPLAVQTPQLSADQNGSLHFAFRDTRPPVSRVLYAMWHNERWSETINPTPRSIVSSFALLNDGETVHLVMNSLVAETDTAARVWVKLVQ